MIFHFHDAYPLSIEKASYFKNNGMFATGEDFSHGRRLQSVGRGVSLLSQLWENHPGLNDWCEGVDVWWIEEKNVPVSVLVQLTFLNSKKSSWGWPSDYAGHWVAFTRPEYRHQGCMKKLLGHVTRGDFKKLNTAQDKISAEGFLKEYLDKMMIFRSCSYWGPSVAKDSWIKLHWVYQ